MMSATKPVEDVPWHTALLRLQQQALLHQLRQTSPKMDESAVSPTPRDTSTSPTTPQQQEGARSVVGSKRKQAQPQQITNGHTQETVDTTDDKLSDETTDTPEKLVKEDEEDVSASKTPHLESPAPKTPRLESPVPSPTTTSATMLPTGAPVNGLPYADQWAAWAQQRMATSTFEQQARMQIIAAAQQQWMQQYCREIRVWAEQLKKQLQNNVHSTVDQFASTFCRQIESKVGQTSPLLRAPTSTAAYQSMPYMQAIPGLLAAYLQQAGGSTLTQGAVGLPGAFGGGTSSALPKDVLRKKRSKVTDSRLAARLPVRSDSASRRSPAPSMVVGGMSHSSTPLGGNERHSPASDFGTTSMNNNEQSQTLTPVHLRKAKLMFFFTRYPSSTMLKGYFPDIQFNKNNTAQLVKWFSNFREFYYIQMEKFARQAVADGVRDASKLVINTDDELYKALNQHYNRTTPVMVGDRIFTVPPTFRHVVEVTLREFFSAIFTNADADPSWKKKIYKVIARLDEPIPDNFRSTHFADQID